MRHSHEILSREGVASVIAVTLQESLCDDYRPCICFAIETDSSGLSVADGCGATMVGGLAEGGTGVDSKIAHFLIASVVGLGST